MGPAVTRLAIAYVGSNPTRRTIKGCNHLFMSITVYLLLPQTLVGLFVIIERVSHWDNLFVLYGVEHVKQIYLASFGKIV